MTRCCNPCGGEQLSETAFLVQNGDHFEFAGYTHHGSRALRSRHSCLGFVPVCLPRWDRRYDRFQTSGERAAAVESAG
jgi:hypothetical protein